MERKPRTTKPGIVKKVIEHPESSIRQRSRLRALTTCIERFRIENELEDDEGKKVRPKRDAHVDLAVEAEDKDTIPEQESDAKGLDQG